MYNINTFIITWDKSASLLCSFPLSPSLFSSPWWTPSCHHKVRMFSCHIRECVAHAHTCAHTHTTCIYIDIHTYIFIYLNVDSPFCILFHYPLLSPFGSYPLLTEPSDFHVTCISKCRPCHWEVTGSTGFIWVGCIFPTTMLPSHIHFPTNDIISYFIAE